MNSTHTSYWRILNTVALLTGALAPWGSKEVDVFPVDGRVVGGLQSIVSYGLGALAYVFEPRFAWACIFGLVSIGGVFAIAYTMTSALSTVGVLRRSHTPLRIRLIAGSSLLLLLMPIAAVAGELPLWGYWLTLVALVSSAMLEARSRSHETAHG